MRARSTGQPARDGVEVNDPESSHRLDPSGFPFAARVGRGRLRRSGGRRRPGPPRAQGCVRHSTSDPLRRSGENTSTHDAQRGPRERERTAGHRPEKGGRQGCAGQSRDSPERHSRGAPTIDGASMAAVPPRTRESRGYATRSGAGRRPPRRRAGPLAGAHVEGARGQASVNGRRASLVDADLVTSQWDSHRVLGHELGPPLRRELAVSPQLT